MKRPRTRYLTLGAAVAAFTALDQSDLARARSEPPALTCEADDGVDGLDANDAREAALQTHD